MTPAETASSADRSTQPRDGPQQRHEQFARLVGAKIKSIPAGPPLLDQAALLQLPQSARDSRSRKSRCTGYRGGVVGPPLQFAEMHHINQSHFDRRQLRILGALTESESNFQKPIHKLIVQHFALRTRTVHHFSPPDPTHIRETISAPNKNTFPSSREILMPKAFPGKPHNWLKINYYIVTCISQRRLCPGKCPVPYLRSTVIRQ